MRFFIFHFCILFLLASAPVRAEKMEIATIQKVNECLKKRDAILISKCVSPYFSSDVPTKKILKFSMYLTRYEVLKNARVCSKEDRDRFPMTDGGVGVYCADLQNSTFMKVTLWKFSAGTESVVIEDFKVN